MDSGATGIFAMQIRDKANEVVVVEKNNARDCWLKFCLKSELIEWHKDPIKPDHYFGRKMTLYRF